MKAFFWAFTYFKNLEHNKWWCCPLLSVNTTKFSLRKHFETDQEQDLYTNIDNLDSSKYSV